MATEAELESLAQRLSAAGGFSFACETAGTQPMTARLVGLSFALEPGEAFYVPLAHTGDGSLEAANVFGRLGPLLEDEKLEKAGHNLKFHQVVLARNGVPAGRQDLWPKGLAFDTMVASYVLNPSRRQHNLAGLALEHFNYTMTTYEDVAGKGAKQVSFDQVPIEAATAYACEDAEVTFQLYEAFVPRLRQTDQRRVFEELEMPLLPVLVRLERVGIRFDADGAARLSGETEGKLEGIRARIYELAGEKDFNINSIVELQRVMYEKLAIHQALKVRPKKIKTGMGLSTDEETLEKMTAHPLPRALLEYRELAKLKSTYLDQLAGFINPVTGKIHSSFRQAVAATGRLASDNPNLQNIPVRSEEGRKVR
ncbi:MAG: DNA polymerase I, partial [Chloroflexi bacterium]|nr:DNA polymerase I [Chloroflexota bacterium]